MEMVDQSGIVRSVDQEDRAFNNKYLSLALLVNNR